MARQDPSSRIVENSTIQETLRISVGAHWRVWWLWLPLIVCGMALLAAFALWPVSSVLAIAALGVSAAGLVWAATAAVIIVRGQRWLELHEKTIRFVDRRGVIEFHDDQVCDLALSRVRQHAAGKVVAVHREVRLWVRVPNEVVQVCLINRISPRGVDPLKDWIESLCERLLYDAVIALRAGGEVDGDRWSLSRERLNVSEGPLQTSLLLEAIAAVEIVGQEVRIWKVGHPRALIRLPCAGRNSWMLERLLHRPAPVAPVAAHSAGDSTTTSRLGRILFERTHGPALAVAVAFVASGIAAIGLLILSFSIPAADVVGLVIGLVLTVFGGLGALAAVRVRHLRFSCYEYGVERVSLTGRQILMYSEIDAFSFEARRNHSHGRYTGTTYTLIFADRSRSPGRGIFFSTTGRNTDDDFELLKERVSAQIARRMVAAFARSRRVQWTPELWFREDSLEFSRPRRLLAGPKLAVVPYDAVTHFEVRDGMFYLWTNYQERAVISTRTSAANFYPGLIVCAGLVNVHHRPVLTEWTPATKGE